MDTLLEETTDPSAVVSRLPATAEGGSSSSAVSRLPAAGEGAAPVTTSPSSLVLSRLPDTNEKPTKGQCKGKDRMDPEDKVIW
ncbi:MAG: hypothetical protein ACKPKO_57710, partial [Candidatus Fonsibacter sp.]